MNHLQPVLPFRRSRSMKAPTFADYIRDVAIMEFLASDHLLFVMNACIE
jgi:hypothetical protein